MVSRIGQQLGSYRILQLLGQGGFAEVYLGEHVYLKTQAAVKVLQTRLSGSEDLESFLTEARTIAHLSHPNIVRVMDFGVDNETPFLVMDYAPNGTLRQKHPKGSRLPLPTVVTYIKQIADALQYAHDEKLIHRDIKPENMLLDRRNTILLSDFGIALVAQSSRYQSTQDVIGTVAYMSPEQIQGKPRPASDQYSLAIVVYEWLSGDRPFHGSFTELCTQHMFASPPPLHEKLASISPDVEQVVTIALSKEPKQRFGNVQAFANALEHASQKPEKASKPVPTPPVIESSKATSLPSTDYAPPKPALPPTEYAPPPLVPTQLANVAPVSNVGTPYANNIQQQSKPTMRVQPTKQRSIWRIGKREWIAMIVGVIVCSILSNILFFPTSSLKYEIVPFIVGIVFFGITFGPWVGLVTGFISELVATLVYSNYHVHFWTPGTSTIFIHGSLRWEFLLYFMLIGFVGGLTAKIINKGIHLLLWLFIIDLINTFAVFALLILAELFYFQFDLHPYASYFWLVFSYYIVPNTIFSFIVLPLLVFAYRQITRRTTKTVAVG